MMVIILCAIIPACEDDYEEGMQLTKEYLYAKIFNYYSTNYAAWGGQGGLDVYYAGNRITLTGVPEWITLEDYTFNKGPGSSSKDIEYTVEPNWSGHPREATLTLTSYSSDGVYQSNECIITQQSYTAGDLHAFIYNYNTHYGDIPGSGGAGVLKIEYKGDNITLTGVPDWITVESYEFVRQSTYNISTDLDYTVTANNTGSTREAKITITSYLGDGTSRSDYCTITQSSK